MSHVKWCFWVRMWCNTHCVSWNIFFSLHDSRVPQPPHIRVCGCSVAPSVSGPTPLPYQGIVHEIIVGRNPAVRARVASNLQHIRCQEQRVLYVSCIIWFDWCAVGARPIPLHAKFAHWHVSFLGISCSPAHWDLLPVKQIGRYRVSRELQPVLQIYTYIYL